MYYCRYIPACARDEEEERAEHIFQYLDEVYYSILIIKYVYMNM